MYTPRKFWLVLGAAVAALVVIACSCNQFLPAKTPTAVPTYPPAPTPMPQPTQPPQPTEPPQPIDPMPGLAGTWLDPDTTGTITTIVFANGGYAVQSVVNPDRGGNDLTTTNWSNGVLTWTYCVSGGACVTSQTISVYGNSLDTSWSNDQGSSGLTTMQRTNGGSAASSQEAIPGLAGQWVDPDTTGTYHIIVWQNGKYVVTMTANPNRGGNELTSSTWANGTLTWTYCVSNGACVTTQTLYVSGDYLYTSWSNDEGNSGSTTMTRVR